MIRAVIIDDEPMARQGLSALLEKFCPEVTVIGEAGDVEAGIHLIRMSHPELLLLDIHLTDGSSFEILERLKDNQYKIIFVTAFEEYAITAFKFSALDYILKPVNPQELLAAINKVHDSLDHEFMARKLEILQENLTNLAGEERKIALRTAASIHIVNLSEIIRCQSDKNYTQFHLKSGEMVVVSKTLKDFEELLSPYRFLRVHQSHLVNMNHIRKYSKTEGGTLILSDNSRIPVSMRKKDDLMKIIGQLKY